LTVPRPSLSMDSMMTLLLQLQMQLARFLIMLVHTMVLQLGLVDRKEEEEVSHNTTQLEDLEVVIKLDIVRMVPRKDTTLLMEQALTAIEQHQGVDMVLLLAAKQEIIMGLLVDQEEEDEWVVKEEDLLEEEEEGDPMLLGIVTEHQVVKEVQEQVIVMVVLELLVLVLGMELLVEADQVAKVDNLVIMVELLQTMDMELQQEVTEDWQGMVIK